jgi:hypothetical protein
VPAFPDRVRDQENPADLRRSAWLRSEPHPGISQYSVLGRCPAGFPIACPLRTSRPPRVSPAPAGHVWLVRSRSAECRPPLPCSAGRSTALNGQGVAAERRSVSLGRSPLARPDWGRMRALGLCWTLRHQPFPTTSGHRSAHPAHRLRTPRSSGLWSLREQASRRNPSASLREPVMPPAVPSTPAVPPLGSERVFCFPVGMGLQLRLKDPPQRENSAGEGSNRGEGRNQVERVGRGRPAKTGRRDS